MRDNLYFHWKFVIFKSSKSASVWIYGRSNNYIRKEHKKGIEWYVHFIGKSVIWTAMILPFDPDLIQNQDQRAKS